MAQTSDLDLLRQRIGLVGQATASLAHDLDVATAWVEDRCYPTPDGTHGTRHPEVTEGILLLAQRLYERRRSPEGVAGWGDLGVVRILADDPDLRRMLELHLDTTRAGIA